ncbi:MAG: hypothetical protein WCB68_22015 [Pyrinomonadaceae bacterium]
MKQIAVVTLLMIVTSPILLTQRANAPARQRISNQVIRNINLKNHAYQDAVKTLKDDWADVDAQEKDIESFQTKSTYGDITGDGNDDAAVYVRYGLGGVSTFTGVFIYTLKTGNPILLARAEGGDRAHGAIERVKIQNGQLIVGRYRPSAEDDCMACYRYIEITTYEWLDSRLVNVGVQTRKFTPPKVNNIKQRRMRIH